MREQHGFIAWETGKAALNADPTFEKLVDILTQEATQEELIGGRGSVEVLERIIADNKRMKDGEKWLASMLVKMTVAAMQGIADAAVIADKPFDASLTLNAVTMLRDRAKELTKVLYDLQPYVRHKTTCQYSRNISEGSNPDSDFCSCDLSGITERVNKLISGLTSDKKTID